MGRRFIFFFFRGGLNWLLFISEILQGAMGIRFHGWGAADRPVIEISFVCKRYLNTSPVLRERASEDQLRRALHFDGSKDAAALLQTRDMGYRV